MAFREKIAWVALAALCIAYGAYFLVLGPNVRFGEQNLVDVVWSFGPVAVAHALITISGSIVVATTAPRDAKRPADERDRAISQRSNAIGYYAILVGLIFVGVIMPFSEPPFKIINVALAVLFLVEILRYGTTLLSYRRGWNG
jgi:hypothetical protein